MATVPVGDLPETRIVVKSRKLQGRAIYREHADVVLTCVQIDLKHDVLTLIGRDGERRYWIELGSKATAFVRQRVERGDSRDTHFDLPASEGAGRRHRGKRS